MPVNWGLQQYQPRTQLDLSPLNQFAQARRDKVQKSLADLTLSNAEKAQRKAEELKEIDTMTIGNPGGRIQRYEQAGYTKEATALKTQIAQAQKARFEQNVKMSEINQKKRVESGRLARTVLESKDPNTAYQLMRKGKEKEWPEQYTPQVEQQLNFLGQSTLTPEQKLAKQKEGMNPEEVKFKKREFRLKENRLALDEKRLQSEMERQTKGLVPQEKAFALESGYRKEYIAQNKEFQSVGDAYNRIQASGNDPSAAGDLSLIFNFMKMLDPGSVVRESEFATAQNAGGVDDRVRASYNKVLRGERLSKRQRGDFMKRSSSLMDAALIGYDRSVVSYRKLAKTAGLDPSRVVIDLKRNKPETQKYRVGEIVDGYEFIGGNWREQSSWKKAGE